MRGKIFLVNAWYGSVRYSSARSSRAVPRGVTYREAKGEAVQLLPVGWLGDGIELTV